MTSETRSTWSVPGGGAVPFEPKASLEIVEVWRDRLDGLWRWRYRGEDGPELPSNRAYPDEAQALDAAGIAYPGVLIRVLEDDATTPPVSARRRWMIAALLLAAIFTAGLAMVVLGVAIGGAALTRTIRRRVRRPGRQ